MSNKMLKTSLSALALTLAAPLAPLAEAFDMTVTGFIRQEMAYKYTNQENPHNRWGSRFNGKTTPLSGPLVPPALQGAPTLGKTDQSKDNDWNLFGTKSEIDFNFNFSPEFTGFMKLRGYYMWDVFKDGEDADFIDGEGGKVNHWNVENHGKEATYLSFSNNDYLFDIPALYLDWTRDKYWIRVGQQQIAWGESLFFRVADIANGLDLRRHVFYDLGAEEYADERLAAPGIRASMAINPNWEIEVFAQMFQPSILPNSYTPFNLITNGFVPDYQTGYDKVQDNINVGFRLQGDNLGESGQWGVQFFAVSGHNPNPIFNLAPGGQELPLTFGPGWETQPFIWEADGIGTTQPAEWFHVSGVQGADGVAVINNLVNDWEWINAFVTQGLGFVPNSLGEYVHTIDGVGHPLDVNGVNANEFLMAFFAAAYSPELTAQGLDSLSGIIEAHYASENTVGFGVNYIFYDEPDSLLDQLVVRFEANYTPDRKFSNNLATEFLEHDEWFTSLVLEKYHRFSQDFPATFFIFEWMHRSETDLLGRHLSSVGGSQTRRPGGAELSRGWDGIVFAFQQPFPSLVWRIDTSILWDLNGGFLFQPAVRYKPNNEWTLEGFVNVVDGKMGSIFQPFDYMDDVTLRITYQF